MYFFFSFLDILIRIVNSDSTYLLSARKTTNNFLHTKKLQILIEEWKQQGIQMNKKCFILLRWLGHQDIWADLHNQINSKSTSYQWFFNHWRQKIWVLHYWWSKHLEQFALFCLREKKNTLWRSLKNLTTSHFLHKGARISLLVKTFF